MKNIITMGKRRGFLPILFGMFVITAFLISCSGKKQVNAPDEIDNTAPDDDNQTLLLSDIQTYDRDNLEKSEDLGIGVYGGGDYEDEIFVYYTLEDKKIKIIESLDGKLMYIIRMTCYFINDNDCRIEFSFFGFDQFMKENDYEEENGNIYYVINDVLYRDINGTKVQQDDQHEIINRINIIKNKFNERYR